MKKIAVVLTLAVAFCFVLTSVALAGPGDPATKRYINNNVKNKKKATTIPMWQITQGGTNKSVTWVDAINPRFAVYDPGTPSVTTDDVVLDKETGMVWMREPIAFGGIRDWESDMYRPINIFVADRYGWRLPRVDEVGSLLEHDPTVAGCAMHLPLGHPFILPECLSTALYVWTATTRSTNSGAGTHAFRVTRVWDGEEACCNWSITTHPKTRDDGLSALLWSVRAPMSVEGR